jgi:hypothetical protein
LGLGHSGLWHFQSHLGSSQTASHSGLGTYEIKFRIFINIRSQNILVDWNYSNDCLSYLAMSNTVGGFANGNTFRAIFHFTGFFRAHNLTVRSIITINKRKICQSIESLLVVLIIYLSHLTSQTAFLGSWHEEWHLGGSQTGVQIASHLGSSHFQEHSGWHF